MAPRSLMLSRGEIPDENENSSERKEILCQGYYYDVTNWIDRHPGGKIIKFYTENGEDATLAIQQFHHRSGNKVEKILKSFQRRPAPIEDDFDLGNRKRHNALTDDFVKLYHDLEKEGYFEPSLLHLTYRLGELLALSLIGGYLCIYNSHPVARFIGSLLMGMFGARCGWLQHEGGHNSLTGVPKIDKFICAAAMGLAIGGSSSWWNSQHNRHHAMPQRISRDVDLDTMPLLAFNAKSVKDKKEGRNFFVRHQAVLFFLVDTFLVLHLWKLYLHPRRMIKQRRWVEMGFTFIHYLILYHCGIATYIISMWFGSVYMFTNFALSHTHLPVSTQPKHWVEYGLVHTMDIEPTWIVSWWMGYLNSQVEHHLFPAMPQFRQTEIRNRVRALAAKHDIPYQSCSYFEAVKKTFSNLQQVSHHIHTD